MTITFISNYFNHHQKPVADELYRLTKGNYRFVETRPMSEEAIRGGYKEFNPSYVVRSWKSEAEREEGKRLVLESDVLIYGGISNLNWIRERQRNKKVTIEYGERWLKKGWLNLLSPNLWKWVANYYFRFRHKPVARLCTGIYSKKDMDFFHAYRSQCYRWGYFPVLGNRKAEELAKKFTEKKLKLIWVARMIGWKHPELALEVASELKRKGIDFELAMYGAGPLKGKCEKTVQEIGLVKEVKIKGAKPTEEVRKAMAESHILLFTSDRNEGWGAVVNEAMGEMCCVVACEKIGASTFLIEHDKTGMAFSTPEELKRIAADLALNRNKVERIARNGYDIICTDWSSENAASNLFTLCSNLLDGGNTEIVHGPASPIV